MLLDVQVNFPSAVWNPLHVHAESTCWFIAQCISYHLHVHFLWIVCLCHIKHFIWFDFVNYNKQFSYMEGGGDNWSWEVHRSYGVWGMLPQEILFKRRPSEMASRGNSLSPAVWNVDKQWHIPCFFFLGMHQLHQQIIPL